MPDDTIAGGIEPAAWLTYLRAEIGALRAVFTGNELGLAVPDCPGWDLRELAVHLGRVHRWVRGALVEGHPTTSVPQAPEGGAELIDWYDEGAARLLDLLAMTDPDTPCWTFGPQPRTARFWFRRQAHEHAIHLHDALTAVGAVATFDVELAADGVDEIVTIIFPRQVRLERIAPLDRSLGLRASDAPGREWVLAGDGAGVGATAPGGVDTAEAVVSAPAEALYLLLWKRIGLDDPRLVLDGDAEATRAVLGTAIVP